MLKLSSEVRRNTTVGEIVNLMSIDAQNIQDAVYYGFRVIQAPIAMAISLFFLWKTVGPAAISGILVILILLPLNAGVLAMKIKSLQV